MSANLIDKLWTQTHLSVQSLISESQLRCTLQPINTQQQFTSNDITASLDCSCHTLINILLHFTLKETDPAGKRD